MHDPVFARLRDKFVKELMSFHLHHVARNNKLAGSEICFHVVRALTLAWALLDQAIAPIQLVGAALVVGTVMWLGLRKR